MSDPVTPRKCLDDMSDDSGKASSTAQRATWMSELARAPLAPLESALDAALGGRRPEFQWIRPPEIGLVMTRGRAGGEGAPFNLGEITATRCALRLECGTEGVAYVLGRSAAKAELAALADALLQTDRRAALQETLIAPLRAARQAREAAEAAQTAATKVDFFTLVRGEDDA